jgi:hypothetical protein
MSSDTISNILSYLMLFSFIVYLGIFGTTLYLAGMSEKQAVRTALSIFD